MSEFAVITYSALMAAFGMVVLFFPFEDDDDQDGGKMIPIPLKKI